MEQTENKVTLTIEIDPKQIENVKYCLGRIRGVVGIVGEEQ